MADIRCPMCGKPNPDDLEKCAFCGARLKPLLAPSPEDLPEIYFGETPVKRPTSELTKGTSPFGKVESVQVGAVPTRKNTGDLESTFPMSLRPKPEQPPASELAKPFPDSAMPPSSSLGSTSQSEDGRLSDWLAGLEAASKGDESQDWLASIRDQSTVQSGQAAEEASSIPAEGADWLKRLDHEEKEEPAQPVGGGKSFSSAVTPIASALLDGLPDWFAEQKSEPTPGSPAANQPIAPAAKPEEEVTSWLAGLEAEPGKVQPGAVAAPFDEIPDWLKKLQAESRAPTRELPRIDVPFEESPDWLAKLQASAFAGEKPPASSVAPPEEKKAPELALPIATLDWKSELQAGVFEEEERTAEREVPPAPMPAASPETTPAEQPAQAIPDWLAEFDQAAPVEEAPAAPAATTESATPAEELPDWLAKLGADAAPVQEVPPAPTPATPPATTLIEQPAQAIPDWLAEFEQATSAAELPAGLTATPESAAPVDEISDWLAKFGADTGPVQEVPPAPTPAAPPVTTPAEQPGQVIPDWLAEFGQAAPVEETPAAPAAMTESAAPVDEISDWLEKFSAEAIPVQEAPPAPPLAVPSATTPAEQPDQVGSDWLAEFEQAASAEEVPVAPISAPETAAPATLSESKTTDATKGEADISMEMPEWISALKPEDDEKKAPVSGVERPGLAPAELPSWVQDLRPVEAVVSESGASREEEETAMGGPLAGLGSVLPLGPGLGGLRKPQPYSEKIHVTESQQRHAASLRRLVAAENEPRLLSGQIRLRSANLLRWIIVLLLILAAGLPLVAGIQVAPAVNPSELSPTRDLINNLQANSPVLLIFDYEPGLSGELEAAAAPVMEHLLFRVPRLAIISTSPTGPILADSFLKKMPTPSGYINLGYLAGGPTAVLGFAANPPMVAAYTLEGDPAWQTPTLQGVQKLSDFAAVIVLTDNPDTGRTWIEQAGPYLDKDTTPMVMVISAQAEPMIRPYYDSGQIKGLVSGLAGGKAYEQANEQVFAGIGLARRYWDAFSAGSFMIGALVLAGSLWSAIAAWRSSSGKKKEEGA
jgi:hypothetical protein